MVETLAAMFVLSVGILGVFGLFLVSSDEVGVGKDRAAALRAASEHVEEIRAKPYGDVVLTAYPPSSTDPDDPNSAVEGQSYRYDPNKPAEPLAVVPFHPLGLSPDAVTRTAGAIQVSLYRYVTWVDDSASGGTADFKRLTVVARWTVGRAPVKQMKIVTLVTPT